MSDNIRMGQIIRELRIRRGLTQKELGGRINVRPATVSKWENKEDSLPGICSLPDIADLFECSIDYLFGRPKSKEIYRIVLTGAPCSGKTKCLEKIVEIYKDNGIKVIPVPEVSTLLINCGFKPDKVGVNEYQKAILKMQLEIEDNYLNMIKNMDGDKFILLCDRGALDGAAYLTKTEFECLLKSLGLNRMDLLNRYDMVFHLVTCAIYSEERFKSNASDTLRIEEQKRIKELHQKTLDAWMGHDNLKIVKYENNFDTKLDNVKTYIDILVNKPEKYVRKRFLVDNSPEILEYEKTTNKECIYIFESVDCDNCVKMYTMGSDRVCIENTQGEERTVTSDEFLKIYINKSDNCFCKNRYFFTKKDCYYKMDVIPSLEDKCIIEVDEFETGKNKENPLLKDAIDVTDKPEYSDHGLFKENKRRISELEKILKDVSKET